MPCMNFSSLLLRTDLSAKVLRSVIGGAIILIANRVLMLLLGIALARYLVRALWLCAGINIILNLVLIPAFGVEGQQQLQQLA